MATWVQDMTQAGVGYETRRLAVLHLGRLLTAAADTGAVSYVATAGVSPGKRGKATDIYVPTHAQARAVVNAVDARYRLLLKMLAMTGMRQGETFALRVCDLHLDDTPAWVSVSRSVDASAARVKDATKTGKSRKVTVPAVLVDELRAHVRGKEKGALVFTSPQGQLIRAGNWRRRVWNTAVAKAQAQDPTLERFTPHELRHFYATTTLASGVPTFQVAKELGHTSTSMTQDVYARWSPVAGEAAANAAAAALGYDVAGTTDTDTDAGAAPDTDNINTDTDADTTDDADADTGTTAGAGVGTGTDTDTDADTDTEHEARRRRWREGRGVPPLFRRD